MRHRLSPFTSTLFFSFVFVLAGCDCGGPVVQHGTACTSNAQCHGGQVCIDGFCRLPVDSGPGVDGATPGMDSHLPTAVAMSAVITPASATLTSTDGSRPMQAFIAQIVYDDGSMGPATTTDWSLDSRAVGDIDPAGGTFTANGVVGGTATVTVMAGTGGTSFTATATVEVVIERTVMGAGVPMDVATTFAGATAVSDPARESGLVYPLDQAVMPQNVYPADFQWTRGTAGDLVRITLTKPSIEVTTYLVDDANHHWLADIDAWRSLAQTNPDTAAMIRADHIDASTGELLRGTEQHLTFARAALNGSIYYWAIAQGRIQRIDDGTATRVNFMPAPPSAPGPDGHDRCVGCHSVSPSGRYMVGRLGGGNNGGTVFDLTTDLTPDPAPSVWPPSSAQTWWFSSWSPDETRIVVSFVDPGPGGGGQLRFMNPLDGTYIDPAGMPAQATHPAWSHDGTRIAYSTNLRVLYHTPDPDMPYMAPGGWGGDYREGDIAVLQVTGPDMVGASTVIHHGTDLASSVPAGNGDAYPTWSPPDTAIAFAHGTGSRSDSDQSALYIMAPDGSGVVRLDAASGAGTQSYQPRFSPFTQGGYFWLSFLSRRDYGNAQVGTAGTARQQIWVTAISTTGTTGGVDPSRVGYWLPGQDTASQNISAYWAPRACRADGDTCSTGTECCGGECAPDATGALVCSPPPPDRCHRVTETCSSDTDCCASDHLACIDHVCAHPIM